MFSDLSPEELKRLSQNKYSVNYKGGEVICKQGTKPLGLLCLKRGKVKVVRRKINGTAQIIGLKKAVNFLGFKSLMSGEPSLSTTVSLEDSEVCVIDRESFFQTLSENKELAYKIIKSMARDQIRLESRLINLTQKHLRGRLAESLLLIYDIFGIDKRTQNLNIRLKRSDIAGLSNMTVANAIRVLGSFKNEGLIEVKKRDIKILDLMGLRLVSAYDR